MNFRSRCTYLELDSAYLMPIHAKIMKIRRANGPKACKTLRTGMLLQLHVYNYFYMYTCAGRGTPPGYVLALHDFGVRLFPNSFGLIPELVYLSSEVAWLIPGSISPFSSKK